MEFVRSSDGTEIAFDRLGDGPPVILVCAALRERTGYAPLSALLAQHFTVFAYDRRGRGDSGDTPPYAIEREIEDLEAVIEEAGGSAFVFGWSSGAVLALKAAARGLAITKLALYEPPFIVNDSRAPLSEDYVERVAELAASGRRDDAVEYFMTAAVGLPVEFVDGMRDAPSWAAMASLAHTLAYDGAIMGDTMSGKPLPAGRWASATMPTLVMAGGASEAHFQDAAQALAGILPDAELGTLDGQNHGAPAAAPEILAPLLVEFFKS